MRKQTLKSQATKRHEYKRTQNREYFITKGAKLTAHDAVCIQDYTRHFPHVTNTKVAEMWGITPSMVHHIRTGKCWSKARQAVDYYKSVS